MNLSTAAIFALALHSASAEFNHLRAVSRGGRSRALQACDAITWSKSCRETSGCAWSGGNCVSTPPPGPTPPPPSPSPPTDPLPTSQPTPLPTFMPVPAGAGYCSDGSGECYATSECACGAGGAAASSTVFERHLQDCGSFSRKKDCPSSCVWLGSGVNVCANPQTSAPTNKVSCGDVLHLLHLASAYVSLLFFVHR